MDKSTKLNKPIYRRKTKKSCITCFRCAAIFESSKKQVVKGTPYCIKCWMWIKACQKLSQPLDDAEVLRTIRQHKIKCAIIDDLNANCELFRQVNDIPPMETADLLLDVARVMNSYTPPPDVVTDSTPVPDEVIQKVTKQPNNTLETICIPTSPIND